MTDGTTRQETTIADVMAPRAATGVFTMASVAHARVGHALHVFHAVVRQHGLVVRVSGGGGHPIRSGRSTSETGKPLTEIVGSAHSLATPRKVGFSDA